MRRILKFKLQPVIDIETEDPPRFLSVGWQGEDLVVWCEATPGTGHVTRMGVAPTGSSVPEGIFIGTAQHPTMLGGNPLVVHVYQRLP